jgi:hypothetical protein
MITLARELPLPHGWTLSSPFVPVASLAGDPIYQTLLLWQENSHRHMAEPFSIIAGSAGLADVCIRLANFIKQARDRFQKVDEDLEHLSKEIEALYSVNNLVKYSFEANPATTKHFGDQQILFDHWKTTRITLASCQELIEKMNDLVISVWGNGSPKHVKLNSQRKYLKLQSKEDEFTELRRKLNAHQIALQTSLAAINV